METKYSDKTYSVSFGAGATAFFAESEPDTNGIVRGTIALDMDEEKVTSCEPASIHFSELKEVVEGICWPEGVTA